MPWRKREIRTQISEFVELMENAGFDQIEVGTGRVYWKELDQRGRHVLIQAVFVEQKKRGRRVISETVTICPSLFPNWTTRLPQISVYAGPELQENFQHQEIAYEPDDLVEFLIDEGVLSEP